MRPAAMLMLMLFHFLLLLVVGALGVPGSAQQQFDYPSAKPSTTWGNTDASLAHHLTYSDGSVARAALLRLNPAGYGPSFAFGFFCSNSNRHNTAPCTDEFLLGVAVVYSNSGGLMTSLAAGIPQVVWSANRGRPVGEGAAAEFTASGDLVLKAPDGEVVWSAGTAGRGVAGMMSVNSDGNLVLFDGRNRSVWQSFDHPTDTLLFGQTLRQGAKLSANDSAGVYLTVAADGLSAYVDAKPPQRYYHLTFGGRTAGGAYAAYSNGSLAVLVARAGGGQDEQLAAIQLPAAASGTVQYMRLEHDGHLRLYEWGSPAGWAPVFDVLRLFPDGDGCAFPTVCGAYGVCTDDLQCSCPDAANFRPVDFRRPNRGCVPVRMPVSDCTSAASQSQQRKKKQQRRRLVSLRDVVYFNDRDTSMRAIDSVTDDACKKACLDDCNCVAAQFVYGADPRDGSCALQSEVFSLQTSQPEIRHYNSTVYLKVQAK